MFIQSIKFTIRSLFRDIVRGYFARTFAFPRIASNEFNASQASYYLDELQLHTDQRSQDNITKLIFINNPNNCTDKSAILRYPQKFIQRRTPRTFIRNHIFTSGSTGTPLRITQDIWAVILEEAFVYRQLHWAGYRNGDRRAWLRGDVVSNGASNNGIYGCRDWWSNTLMLSSYHISSATARSYIDALNNFNPVIIQAYPSSIHALASWMLSNKVRYKGNALRGIVTSSETLEADTQARIEQAFGCRVFDWYGQAERVIAIGTCEHGSRHVLTDYGRVELLPAENGLYELVGTGYNNKAMSLIRYRTGDLVRLSAKQSCPCGRIFPIVDRVIGRRDKVITLPDGRTIGRLDHVFKGADNVIEGQVVYKGGGHFLLRVVPGPNWSQDDESQLIAKLKARVVGVEAHVDTVASIPRGANGKFEFVRIEVGE